METIKKEHLNIRNQKEMIDAIEKTVQRIKEFTKHNDYQLTGDLDQKLNLDKAIMDASLRKRKVLRRYMYQIEQHATLDVVNKFLHFLFKKVLNTDVRVKVTKSEKELAIQTKREAFKAALKIMLEKKQEYLNEKGDFYKVRLEKKQTI